MTPGALGDQAEGGVTREAPAAVAVAGGGACVADGSACVGPVAAAAMAAAGMRHWLRNGTTPPGTPTRGAAPEPFVEPLELEADASSGSDFGRRAHFRLLCTLPDEAPSDDQLLSTTYASDAPLTHRHVAAVLAEDACVVSEDAMAGVVGATHSRAPTAGTAIHLEWLRPPRRCLLVVKPTGGPGLDDALRRCARLLAAAGCEIFVEPAALDRVLAVLAGGPGEGSAGDADGREGPLSQQAVDMVKTWDVAGHRGDGRSQLHGPASPPPDEVAQALDLVVALGGDGTLLWLSHLLGDAPVPPVLAVGLGSLCFLSPFTVKQLEGAVRLGLKGGFHLTLRHRLTCRVVRCRPAGGSDGTQQVACVGMTSYHVVLNECAIDRGAQALTNLECWMDGIFVTRVQGDGLIVATPSGSTAYNLAAGGSMAHPLVPGLLFTPICAHSLSFRPLVFPDSVHLCVRVPLDARGGCFASFDGRDRTELLPGDAVHIALSRWPMPTVCSRDCTTDWVSSIRNTLHWNERRTQGVARED